MNDTSINANYSLLAKCVQTYFYPTLLAITLIYISAEANGQFGITGSAYGLYLGALIATLVCLERLIPMRQEWNMTRQLFFIRDLPMLLINGFTVFLTGKTMLWLSQAIEGSPMMQSSLPWWVEAIIALGLADLMWYWVHRVSHEGKGALGQWMWRTHALHHLPEEVYVFMHVAGHPIQAAIVRVLLMLPAILLGLSPEAIFAAATLNGLQGLVSHFNVDSRAGWFNRIVVGTELHRYHHSADMKEAGNYASFFSVIDQVFGTYRLPGIKPEKLGVIDREKYPSNSDWIGLMKLPFQNNRKHLGNTKLK